MPTTQDNKTMTEDHVRKKDTAIVPNYANNELNSLQTKEIKISVIVSAYNTADYLTATLASIEDQSFKDFEVIVINDGSTDNTAQVAEDYAQFFPNVRVITQENKGPGGAFNTGLENARGEYCTFVDSDDLIKPDMFRQLFIEAEKTKADIVQCGYERSQNGKTVSVHRARFSATGPDTLYHVMKEKYNLSASPKLYRISFLRKHDLKFESHIYHEDIEFTLKVHHFAASARTIPYIGYSWIVRDGSISSLATEKHIKDMSHIIDNLKTFYTKEGIIDRFRHIFYALSYWLFHIALEKIYKEKNLWLRTLLLRSFRRELERHDLDYAEYIQIAKLAYISDMDIFDIFRKAFFWSSGDSLNVNTAALPKSATVNRRTRKSRRIKKFVKNPYIFFADATGPTRYLKYCFIFWRT